jgi:16S rRNA (guanine(1405)-N(7))-methyltransferase
VTGPADELVARIGSSRRYRSVDEALVRRLVREEQARGGRPDDVARRVRRRLHQVVGAFAPGSRSDRMLDPVRDAWNGDMDGTGFRDACLQLLRAHASTRERVPHLAELYGRIWAVTSEPAGSLLDLGCGLGPLALPWMGLGPSVTYHACDADRAALMTVAGFFELVGRPATTYARDLAASPRDSSPAPGSLPAADVALLLKLVPTLDRQDPAAAGRLLRVVEARHAVVSFPVRSLGGRDKGMQRTYRARLEQLVAEAGRVTNVVEASAPNELVFVLELARG